MQIKINWERPSWLESLMGERSGFHTLGGKLNFEKAKE
ncbi:hypothetical protein LEP1GSC202_3568 [Leptospira yanagawae serovar Saopaulo str. Sao Paulo = ATCC 700523]|uniref:Uncharacterized protein n=1 Tax=Leptospira yanagawae serovar Saopaulo str. Sao Paulo = ATCC 700523 TaxID=1249483 RepID=A0A5E8H983_9LEPT|nr:hypothetical protein LEP1GSC202_3568 [Leptospira yanagawae serovar Saopaulo str. Sao Paulo = ATCC 700523]